MPTRLVHPKRVRVEADGETHRRDCECARCEAGFTPSERDRELAARRAAAEQGRRAAARSRARKTENARLRQMDLTTYFRQGNAAADAEVQRLRALRTKTLADQRIDELLRLRRAGMSLPDALAEVDRWFAPHGEHAVDNDNAADSSKSKPAAPSLFGRRAG